MKKRLFVMLILTLVALPGQALGLVVPPDEASERRGTGAAASVPARHGALASAAAVLADTATDAAASTLSWSGSLSPTVFLPLVVQSQAIPTTDRVTQFGITWTFDRAYPYGQFANGDYWVVGPVDIVQIDPPCQTISDTIGGQVVDRVINGSMLDPHFPAAGETFQHGYDSGARRYDGSVNVAKVVADGSPLHIAPGHSLVSTISHVPIAGSRRLQTAAILTILAAPAPEGSFRPSYASVDKTPPHNVSELDDSSLLKLPPPPSTPLLADVERLVERPWIDHYSTDTTLESHLAPSENMQRYGRDVCTQLGNISLMLHLDLSDAEKRTLLIRLVQVGIDLYGVATTGGGGNAWRGWGGHRTCRKWPILFAGIVLHDQAMQNVQAAFAEDELTYYYDDVHLPVEARGKYSWTGSQVLYKFNYYWDDPYYSAFYEHKHPAEWTVDPPPPGRYIADEKCEAYRTCCTAKSWVGLALAVRLMGAMAVWNNPSFFDYVDRWMYEDMTPFVPIINAATGGSHTADNYCRSSSVLAAEMWPLYRNLTDSQPPTTPQNLSLTVLSGGRELAWDRCGDNVGGVGYRVFRDGAEIGTVYETVFLDSAALPPGTHEYRVLAFDWTGNESPLSDPVSIS